jgi:hypothetical protein
LQWVRSIVARKSGCGERSSHSRNNGMFAYLLIILSLFLAFSPVLLSANYIRQDDLMWETWPGMPMKDFGYLYHNTVFELVRPICMFLMYFADVTAINITNAVYLRLAGVMMLCMLGIMLYRWQLLFNAKRILAASFAAAAFTLPAYQVFAATGNYSIVILSGLVMALGAAFLWHAGYHAQDAQQKYRYYYLAFILFFLSLLDYPLSSMYIWVFIAIAFLNTESGKRQFISFLFVTSIKMMVFYYVFCRLIHLLFHVPTKGSRVSVIDTSHITDKFTQIVDVLGWHSNLWLWNDLAPFFKTPAVLLFGLFFLALMKQYSFKNAIYTLLAVLLFFLLSYSPILASPEFQITFRYTITTMPILLYLVFWSITTLTPRMLNAVICIAIAVFGLTYANIMVADGIVGPNTKDFASVEQQLKEKVLPLLEKNQPIVIHGIACDKIPQTYAPKVPTHLEYSMRICQYQQQVIGVIIHSLRKMGVASNFNQHNEVIYNTDEIVVKNIPWGTLVVNSVDNFNADSSQQIVTIDTRTLPPYHHFDFYRQLL